jgi:predicted Zn-dependent protease
MLLLLAFLLAPQSISRAGADAQFAAGEYAEAAGQYLKLLGQTPDNPSLLEAAGVALLKSGRPREAAPLLQRELALDPRNRVAARWLATAFQEGGAFDSAFTLLRELTRDDPKDSESWYRLGLLMYGAGYYSAAAGHLETALRLGLSPVDGERSRAEITRAVALAQAGRPEAEAILREVAARPDGAANLDVRLSLLQIEYEAGRYDAALAESQKALALSESNSAVHFWRARILQALGKAAPAIVEAERSRELAPESPSPRNLLVRLYRTAGRTEEAAREAEWLRAREGEKKQ